MRALLKNFWISVIILPTLFFGMGLAITTAQEEAESVSVQYGNPPTTVTLPRNEPLVLWVKEAIVNPSGQFANAVVFIQDSEGNWVPLTPCDNLMVTCNSVPLRIDGVTQGEQFFLDLETGDGPQP